MWPTVVSGVLEDHGTDSILDGVSKIGQASFDLRVVLSLKGVTITGKIELACDPMPP